MGGAELKAIMDKDNNRPQEPNMRNLMLQRSYALLGSGTVTLSPECSSRIAAASENACRSSPCTIKTCRGRGLMARR